MDNRTIRLAVFIRHPPPPQLDYFHKGSDMLSELIKMRHITKDLDSERYAGIVCEALMKANKHG